MLPPRSKFFLTTSLVTCLFAVGCAKEFPTVPVAGRVTLDGKPVPNARVAFEPIAPAEKILAGPGSYGKTDSTGRFVLESIYGDQGAVVGKHRVTISTAVSPPRSPTGADAEPEREIIPARYRDGAVPLQFEVPAQGTAAADFALESR